MDPARPDRGDHPQRENQHEGALRDHEIATLGRPVPGRRPVQVDDQEARQRDECRDLEDRQKAGGEVVVRQSVTDPGALPGTGRRCGCALSPDEGTWPAAESPRPTRPRGGDVRPARLPAASAEACPAPLRPPLAPHISSVAISFAVAPSRGLAPSPWIALSALRRTLRRGYDLWQGLQSARDHPVPFEQIVPSLIPFPVQIPVSLDDAQKSRGVIPGFLQALCPHLRQRVQLTSGAQASGEQADHEHEHQQPGRARPHNVTDRKSVQPRHAPPLPLRSTLR